MVIARPSVPLSLLRVPRVSALGQRMQDFPSRWAIATNRVPLALNAAAGIRVCPAAAIRTSRRGLCPRQMGRADIRNPQAFKDRGLSK
jgi:hypothetical protein